MTDLWYCVWMQLFNLDGRVLPLAGCSLTSAPRYLSYFLFDSLPKMLVKVRDLGYVELLLSTLLFLKPYLKTSCESLRQKILGVFCPKLDSLAVLALANFLNSPPNFTAFQGVQLITREDTKESVSLLPRAVKLTCLSNLSRAEYNVKN